MQRNLGPQLDGSPHNFSCNQLQQSRPGLATTIAYWNSRPHSSARGFHRLMEQQYANIMQLLAESPTVNLASLSAGS